MNCIFSDNFSNPSHVSSSIDWKFEIEPDTSLSEEKKYLSTTIVPTSNNLIIYVDSKRYINYETSYNGEKGKNFNYGLVINSYDTDGNKTQIIPMSSPLEKKYANYLSTTLSDCSYMTIEASKNITSIAVFCY